MVDANRSTTSSGAANDNRYQFTGRENDGTGLYYYRARYYSPAWGRFVSEDPIGLAGGINLYAYGLGNPVSFADPYGLDVFLCRQPAFGWMPVDHQWLKTDTVEAGMVVHAAMSQEMNMEIRLMTLSRLLTTKIEVRSQAHHVRRWKELMNKSSIMNYRLGVSLAVSRRGTNVSPLLIRFLTRRESPARLSNEDTK
jgi:RHS repeat-associated protein